MEYFQMSIFKFSLATSLLHIWMRAEVHLGYLHFHSFLNANCHWEKIYKLGKERASGHCSSIFLYTSSREQDSSILSIAESYYLPKHLWLHGMLWEQFSFQNEKLNGGIQTTGMLLLFSSQTCKSLHLWFFNWIISFRSLFLTVTGQKGIWAK